jgi:hypothetical protein
MAKLVNRAHLISYRIQREPGGEYPKKLLLRNVEMRTKHIKYTLPATKYFGMDFPQIIVLSPGMSTSLEVVFRPIEKVRKQIIIHK